MNTRICVLIPVYNEEIVIKGTIDSIVSAGVSRSDIYIVNDKSTDNTASIAASTGVSVYTVPENGGKAAAQRAALKYFQLTARYDWVIFLDGDTKADVNFLNELQNAVEKDPTVGLYVGQVKSVKNDHIYSASRASDYAYSHDLVKQGQSNFNVVFVAPGCVSMYRSNVLHQLQIDSDTLAEDMDLTMQVHRLGYKVEYVGGAYVNTQDPSTFHDYHKQVLRWYRGFWQIVKKHDVFSFKKKQRVDWYMMFVTIDSMVLNRVFWLIAMLIINPGLVPLACLIDLGIAFCVSSYAAFKTRRLDLLYKFPIYYWLSFVNLYAYMRAFVEIIVQRKELLAWNKVKRYEFESQTEKGR